MSPRFRPTPSRRDDAMRELTGLAELEAARAELDGQELALVERARRAE